MDIYKLKFTKLQMEILRFLALHNSEQFNQRRISQKLKVSPTAVNKSLIGLQKSKLISVSKDQFSKELSIQFNMSNSKAVQFKRVTNISMLYESGLIPFLQEQCLGCEIIVFGSFSRAEDTKKSDIDIAIIGMKDKSLNITPYERLLGKEISLHFFENTKKIANKHLKINIRRGFYA